MTRARPWASVLVRSRLWALALAAVLIGTAASSGGCGGSEAPHGSPVLLKVYWQVKNMQFLVWPLDPSQVKPVLPAPTQFNLVFDRVLAGSKIEDTVTINGVTGPKQKAVPPVAVSWPDMAASVSGPPNYKLSVWYNSVPLPGEAGGSSYVYGRATPSYPSATPLTIHLDHAGLTSQYNEAMTGPDTIAVTTQAFALADAVPVTVDAGTGDAGDDAGDVDGGVTYLLPHGQRMPVNYWLPLQFNNLPADVQTVLPLHVHVTSDGAPASFRLVPDPVDPTRITLQPAMDPPPAGQPPMTWKNGALVEVTVDATLPDVFGATLGVATSASFVACSSGPCSSSDGGAPGDAAAGDVPADGADPDAAGGGGGGGDAAQDLPIDAPPVDAGAADAADPDAGVDVALD